MRIATAAVLLVVLTACGTFGGDDDTSPSPSATSSSPSEPATNAVPEERADLVGDWHDQEADWTVHFKDDGTFVEDYQGVKDFRVGEYTVEGDTVKLEGDEGNADEGTIEGETLKFKLGTLERVEQ